MAHVREWLHRALWTERGLRIEMLVLLLVIAVMVFGGVVYYVDNDPPVRRDQGLVGPSPTSSEP